MFRITALIHTHNDALRLGRCLETVYPCDEIIVVDHGSIDRTSQIAREYGSKVIGGEPGNFRVEYLKGDDNWILCLDPRESLSEGLAASLFEWKLQSSDSAAITPLSVLLREETTRGWMDNPTAQTRMVPADWAHWNTYLPAAEPAAHLLQGELLRFSFP